MAHWRCTTCDLKTGDPKHHPSDHEPTWERCTCGSGGHPRRCELHPGAYEAHLAELNAEDE